MSVQKEKKISIRIDGKLKREYEAIAKESEKSLSSVVRQGLFFGLRRMKGVWK